MNVKLYHTAFLAALFTLSANAQVKLDINLQKRGAKISDLHHGIFYEDINHAADGGLYAELVRNRSFEDNDSMPIYWRLLSEETKAELSLVSDDLLNDVQKQALRIGLPEKGEICLANEGFWGINVVRDQNYRLSFWAKAEDFKGKIHASLRDHDGYKIYAQTLVTSKVKGEWTRYTTELRPQANDGVAQLVLTVEGKGSLRLDMVSLFPPTFKGRANGLRPELAQLMADLKPRFMRFPGGCFVEGELINGKLEEFKWKTSLGPIEKRAGHYNTWRYPATNGIGFHEMLQLAEDLGAEPLYVTSVGVWHGGFAPHDSLDWYVQDVLDAIEYANGDASTQYGAMRIANGHPEPFNLRMVEIGNENYQQNVKQQSDHYPERYIQFYRAIKAKYPYVTIVGNVEALGTDTPSWRNEHPVDVVDEHYFRSPRWFIDQYNKYDTYPRDRHKIYVGEYAVTREYGVNGNLNAALGEAVYMLGMEHNGDVVVMNSYAPMFKNENEAKWNPDLIHFDSDKVFVTPSYHVQKLFANYIGDYDLPCVMQNNAFPAEYYAVAYSRGDSLLPAVDPSNYMASRRFRYDGEEVKVYYHFRDTKNYGVWNLGADDNHRYNLELHTNGLASTFAYRYRPLEKGQWYDACIKLDNDTILCYLNGELNHKVALYPKQWVYSAASITADGKTAYLKVVNPSGKPVIVDIDLKGATVKQANLIRLTSQYGTDENSMADKERVKPADMGSLPVNGSNLRLEMPGYALDVIEITL